MKKLNFKLLVLLLFPVFCYAQVNPRMVNRKYAQTVYLEDFSSSQTFKSDWTASYSTNDNSLYSFVDTSATIDLNENNSELNLRMIKIPGGYTNSYWAGTFITNFIAGEITSNDYFGYGVYQCNAKFAYDKGSFPAFWLYNDSECTLSKRNEIDIVECKVDNSNPPTLDNNMFYYPPSCGASNGFGFKAHQYNLWNQPHIFECLYAPDRIEFWVDDVLYHTVWDNGDHRYPDQVMRLKLSQQVIRYNDGQNEIVTPQTSSFYWVKAKEFFLAPEITSPELICSNGSGTATLDVAPEATNITWVLTPANLFSGTTSGTGKTASIHAGSVDGLGKITYSFEMPSGESFEAEKTIWVGKPNNIPDIDVWEYSSHQTLLCPSADYYRLHVSVNVTPLRNSIDDYDWEVLDGSGITYPYYADGSNPLPITTSSNFTFARVGAYLHNTCGWSNYPYYNIFTRGYNCGGYFMVFSPNPTTGETTLTIESAPEAVKSTSENSEFDFNEEWDMEIYSPMQTLKEKKTKLKGQSTIIQTNGWMKGVYTVRVKYKDQVLTGKLMVKK